MRGFGIGIEGPARPCRKGHIVDEAERQPLDTGPGDHGAIIGAKRHWRQDEPQPGLAAKPHQRPANGAIGGNPARHDHRGGLADGFAEKSQGHAAAVDDRIDHRGLERGADIGHIGRRQRPGALHFQPDNSTLLIYYSATLMRTGQAAEALTYAQHAVVVAPDSPDAIGMLGFAQFASDHTPDAIRSWKKSLALRPDATISQYLARAERESSAESDFSQRESSHFNLHFEGKDTSETFRRDLLATLNSEYDDLVRDLGYSPRNNIAVTLYTQQAFFDVTRAPSWTGACASAGGTVIAKANAKTEILIFVAKTTALAFQ